MKKEDLASLVVYLLLIAAAIITGCTVVGDVFIKCNVSSFMNPYIFSILVLIIALLFNVIGMELLHALGGKIGGYKIVSVNVLGFCFEKKSDKWHVSFSDFNGLTGETKLSPKSEKTNLKPFVWMPLIGYFLEVGLGFLMITLKQGTGANAAWIGAGALLFIVVSSMIALYNLVPLKLDSMTDGYRLVLISKPENKEALNELMRVEDLQRNNMKVESIKTFDVINDFTASVNLLSVYEFLSENKYDEANAIIEKMIGKSECMDESTYFRLMAQRLYITIMQKGKEEGSKLYDSEYKDNVRRFIANDNTMESLRAYIVVAGFIEESESEVVFINKKVQKVIKKTLASRAAIETKLYNEAIEKIYLEHPNWNKKDIA